MDKRRGFSLVEMLVVTALAVFLISVSFGLLKNAQSSFLNTDASLDLRNGLRAASEKMSWELRQTGYGGGAWHYTIQGGGTSIVFSIPILCTAAMTTILDASGNPAYWGAPLTWGCDKSSCMDANNSCATLEYKSIKYALSGTNFQRSVLDGGGTTVANSTTTLAQNITAFAISAAGNELTFTLTGQKISSVKQTITMSYTNKVFINNFGG